MLDRSNSLVTIPIEHYKVHNGESYTANYLEKNLANDGYMRIHIKTGSKSAHIMIDVESEGKVYFRSFSNPAITADGTGLGTTISDKLTLFNRCGNCANGNTTQVFYNPTVEDYGDMRGNRVFPFGEGGTAPGGSNSTRIESIFNANSSYIIEIQNVSGQSRDTGIVLDWYEAGGKE